MSYTITIEHDPGCIVFRFGRSTSVHQAQEVLDDILRIQREQGISHVLCDASQADDLIGLVDLYAIGLRLTNKAFQAVRLAAFADAAFPAIKFASIVAGKGSGQVKAFNCELAARDWLFQENSGAIHRKPDLMEINPPTQPLIH